MKRRVKCPICEAYNQYLAGGSTLQAALEKSSRKRPPRKKGAKK